ncbi:MAG: DUF192 domain-containing protein [Candidatus Omnitrophota bacterium]
MAEVADSVDKRQKGLMFRKSLAVNQGMIFVYEEEGRHGFWMKNMRFPLDIIWIDRNHIIAGIYESALPCKDICKSIYSQANAKFILEVNAGFIRKHQIKIGDTASF